MALTIHSPNATYNGTAEFGGGLRLEFRDGVAVPAAEVSEGHLAYLRGAGYTITDGPEDAERTAAEVPTWDPTEHSIPEVLEYLGLQDGGTPSTAAEVQRVRDAEADRQEGAVRSSLLKALDAHLQDVALSAQADAPAAPADVEDGEAK